MRFHSLLLSWLLCVVFCLAPRSVCAHPLSHTDAWGKISDHVDLKLSIFLDDVVRHQIGSPEDHDLISAADLQQAIRRHTDLLVSQLRIFDQQGRALSVSVTSVPDWKPRGTEVRLSDNNLLKLTWRLHYEFHQNAAQESASLCFLHSFTHSDLTTAGELRMHLQHVASGNRIDAVIPPGLPHTMLLPRKDEVFSQSTAETNGALSRLVVSPTGIIHEFTAPLLFLDDAWPLAKTFREQSVSPAPLSQPVAIDRSDIATTKRQIETWMRSNARLQVGHRTVPIQGLTVDFFAAGQTPDEQLSTTPDQSTGLPLFGTQVGVRMRFPGSTSAGPVKLSFERSPGVFRVWAVEVTSRTGQTSRQVPVSTEAALPALTFEWSADAFIQLPQDAAAVPDGILEPAVTPLAVVHTRPGIRGVSFGLVGFVLFAGIGYLRRSLSAAVRYACYASGVCVLAVSLLTVSDSKIVVDQQQTTRLICQILSDVYRGTMQPSEDDAMDVLSGVLHEDLVEEIYLATLKSLSSSPENGIILNIVKVNVDSVQVPVAPESLDRLTASCCWNVSGIVHHWGHSHGRDLRLEGELTLIRDAEAWKLLSISQTESTNAAVRMAPTGVQPGSVLPDA